MTKIMSDPGVADATNIHWNILVKLTEQLKLSDSKYDDAVKKYESVAKWLNDSESGIFRDAAIYVQGSVRLGTTIKSYSRNEYDIDLVVHLPHLNKSYSSQHVHKMIGDRLKESALYEDKLSSLNRGWRINYAGDFHLDITPAIPDSECNNLCPINKRDAEFVPDKNLLDWKASNPRGYSKWFHDIDKSMPVFANNRKSILVSESSTIEKAPSQHEFKGVLRRTVQILKRHRDVYFQETAKEYKEWAPISILITTLAAQAYKELIVQDKEVNPIDMIKDIIRNIKNRNKEKDGVFYVENPTNLKENFAEKWNTTPLYEIMFTRWTIAAYNDIEKILSAEGLDIVGKTINASFGNDYGNKVLESISKDVDAKRGLGQLSGIFALKDDATAKVEKNTFYGV